MKILFIVLTVFLALSAIFLLVLSIYSGRPFKNLALNAFVGLLTLGILNATSYLSGINIAINPITVVGAAVFSVPAVIGFLLLNIILL